MKLTSSIFAFGLSAALVAAAPSSPPLAKRYANAITTDAPFSQSDAQLNSVDLICPYGIATQDKKNILFIQVRILPSTTRLLPSQQSSR